MSFWLCLLRMVWGSPGQLTKKLQILQNKTMRFVLGYPTRSHIGIEKFTLLHWIPVCQRVKQIKLNNMYRIVHGNAPQYLKRDISMVNDQHSFFTRNIFLSVVLPHVKSLGKKTFRFSAGKIWNAHSVSLRSAEDLLSFKKGINKHLREELITEAFEWFSFLLIIFTIIQPYKYRRVCLPIYVL